MNFVRKILFPVVPFYFLITQMRNICYDLGIKTSRSYNLPVICVGNLSVGGTGKSPMIEYLISLLNKNYKIATLSRGYKRKSKGFYIADEKATVSTIGDEPFQFYKKFNDIIVSVDANRQNGIDQLLRMSDTPDIILLDDGFQHRKVKAGLNILLTTYDKLYIDDIVLPTGNLREPRSGSKRAHIIVVTKSPDNLGDNEKMDIIKRLNPLKVQHVFFSRIKYSQTIYGSGSFRSLSDLANQNITVVTGIADPQPLLQYLDNNGFKYEHLSFKDHHSFSDKELKSLKDKPFILTTEKDYTRLYNNLDPGRLYYMPIEMEISDPEKFNTLIKKFVKD